MSTAARPKRCANVAPDVGVAVRLIGEAVIGMSGPEVPPMFNDKRLLKSAGEGLLEFVDVASDPRR